MRPLRACASFLLLLPSLALAGAPTAAQRWWSHVEVLAGDGMQGRETGSEGHRRAAEYVASKLAEAGVQPGVGQGFLQDVPLVSRRVAQDKSRLALVRDGKEQPLAPRQDFALSPLTGRSSHVDAGLVFVGYGLSIPEAHHDDFAGLELQGKVLVLLMGGVPPGVPGNLVAHYSSLAERIKAVTRAGAAGVLVVMHPRKMEAPWDVIVGAQSMPTMMLAEPSLQDGADTMPLLGILNASVTDALFAGSGHTFEEVLAQADAGKPLPRFALPASVRADVTLESTPVSSVNVVGRLPGADPKLAGEAVVLSAHLDHLGVGEPVKGDAIYNGAMDNATGVAALLEVARHFQEKKLRPRRTVLFVAVTAEERGELGSRWFAERPPEGTGRLVADLNLDMFLPLHALKQLVAYGVEESSLATPLKASAARLGVEVMRDPNPEANAFVRSDQYSFIRKGVPALAFKFGYRKGSKEERLHEAWMHERYHQPSDDITQPVDREAAARFVQLLADVAARVADAPERPRWNADSYFRRFAQPEAPATARPQP